MEHDKNTERESNDLYYFLTHIPEYWEHYGHYVTAVVVVLAGGLFAYQYFTVSGAESHEKAWAALDSASGADGYASVAIDFQGDPTVAALANLRGADDLLSKASIGRGTAINFEDPASLEPNLPSDEERDKALSGAAARYQEVVNARGVHDYLKHNALLGLASISEARGEFEQAAGYYDKIIESPNATAKVVALATDRKAVLERLRQPIAFVDVEPDPAPTSTGGPLLDGLDSSMPSLGGSGLTVPGGNATDGLLPTGSGVLAPKDDEPAPDLTPIDTTGE